MIKGHIMNNNIPMCNKCASAKMRDVNDSDKGQPGVTFITPDGPNRKLGGCGEHPSISNIVCLCTKADVIKPPIRNEDYE